MYYNSNAGNINKKNGENGENGENVICFINCVWFYGMFAFIVTC